MFLERGSAMTTLHTPLQHIIKRDERGNVGILFGLMLLPMALAIGVAVDYSRGNRSKSDMQTALDAAAIAAIKVTPDVAEEVGTRFFMANFKNDLVTKPVVNIRLEANGQVKATARGSLPLLFGGLIGAETFEISTRSTVEPERTVVETETEAVVFTGGAPCLHVMDQSDQGALELANNTNVEASHCDVRVRSNRSEAMRGRGNSNVKFRSLKVKGNSTTQGGLQVSGWPYTISDDSQIVANPYLDAIRDVVQSVTVGACTKNNTDKILSGANVKPGTYCGDTVFENATLEPGIYVIKSSSGNKNGALSFKGLVESGMVNGEKGVTFYLADNKSTFKSYTAEAGSSLVAPTSGVTRGILFFENSNRGANWDLAITGASTQSWEGLAYLPSANITFDRFSNWNTFKISLAANKVTVKNWSNMTWEPYVWYPFNQSAPILYDDETYNEETTTVSEKPLYIAQ
jgi:Flp pilus assembly protein TadG